jgi:hypothetical protein
MSNVINLRGRKPQALRPGEVYIGRAIYMGGWRLPASKWANPFRVDTPKKKGDGSRQRVMKKYEKYIRKKPELLAQLGELKGKTLACWCRPELCHGDILMKLVGEMKD